METVQNQFKSSMKPVQMDLTQFETRVNRTSPEPCRIQYETSFKLDQLNQFRCQ